MSDLISRSAVLEYLCSGCSLKDHGETPACGTPCSDYTGINDLPAVDAVPVVRCKDCKHRGGYHCPMYHTETSLDDLDGFDDYNVDKTDGDGFCHRGEKKG